MFARPKPVHDVVLFVAVRKSGEPRAAASVVVHRVEAGVQHDVFLVDAGSELDVDGVKPDTELRSGSEDLGGAVEVYVDRVVIDVPGVHVGNQGLDLVSHRFLGGHFWGGAQRDGKPDGGSCSGPCPAERNAKVGSSIRRTT